MNYPSYKQLSLPLLELLNDGCCKASELYTRLADEFNLSPLLRSKTVLDNVSYWKRRVRWAMQSLKKDGLILHSSFNIWELTEEGRRFLLNARPGVVITVYETPCGQAIWGDCQEALGSIENNSVQLCLTSPPYALVQPKEYGNASGDDYLRQLTDRLVEVQRVLKDDGSLVLNLGNTYLSGQPVQSLYQEELVLRLCKQYGFFLAQKFYFYNTTKLPNPQAWVCRDRVRVRDSLESLWWLSKTPNPFADNRTILKEYSSSQKALMAKNKHLDLKVRMERPCQQSVSLGMYRDCGGAIPDNIIAVSHGPHIDRQYISNCKKHGLSPHPARFPYQIPEFFIKFLTRPKDIVIDIFAGSFTTGEVAEKLNRRWIGIEKSFHYIKTSLMRFNVVSPNPLFLG